FSNSKKNTNNTADETTSEQNNTSSPVPQTVNRQASFAIFTNGTFRVFTASMYHNLSEDVFIQSDNPNLVHVKKVGTTWGDFFRTLPFELTRNCLTTGTKETFCSKGENSLVFYLNGVRVDDVLDREIQANDQLLISYGTQKREEIQNQLQKLRELVEEKQ
ncbi:MAG: hypothetical protein HY430_00400, partial [Candidatus Levybacteria bacterium]|nr:hypothetical protein [Candidatus Levybacteria bacterium]